MGIGPIALVLIVGAVIAALGVLGWSFQQARLFLDEIGPGGNLLLIGALVIGGLWLAGKYLSQKRGLAA